MFFIWRQTYTFSPIFDVIWNDKFDVKLREIPRIKSIFTLWQRKSVWKLFFPHYKAFSRPLEIKKCRFKIMKIWRDTALRVWAIFVTVISHVESLVLPMINSICAFYHWKTSRVPFFQYLKAFPWPLLIRKSCLKNMKIR